jgi:hypothetical protein
MFAGLLVASCGGSSEESSDDSVREPVSEESAGEASGSDEADASSDDDSGSNEETEENSGLDLDLDELEETIGDFSTGEGVGIVTIDGVTYEFEGELCVAFEGDISIEGPGMTPDGDPFWGEISIGETERADLAEAGFDDATLDSFFGDNESATDASVEVEIGRTELFGSGPDDKPDYTASIVLDNPLEGEITFEADATNVTGSGQIIDANNVALGFGETLPFEFSGGCN